MEVKGGRFSSVLFLEKRSDAIWIFRMIRDKGK